MPIKDPLVSLFPDIQLNLGPFHPFQTSAKECAAQRMGESLERSTVPAELQADQVVSNFGWCSQVP